MPRIVCPLCKASMETRYAFKWVPITCFACGHTFSRKDLTTKQVLLVITVGVLMFFVMPYLATFTPMPSPVAYEDSRSHKTDDGRQEARRAVLDRLVREGFIYKVDEERPALWLHDSFLNQPYDLKQELLWGLFQYFYVRGDDMLFLIHWQTGEKLGNVSRNGVSL